MKKALIAILIIIFLIAFFMVSGKVYPLIFKDKTEDNPISDEKPKESEEELTLLSVESKVVTDLIKMYAANYNSYCSMNEEYLNDLYSGNFSNKTLHNDTLLLLALTKETLPEYPYEDELNPNGYISYSKLNENLKTILNSDVTINEDLVGMSVTHYEIGGKTETSIYPYMSVFGCTDLISDVAHKTIKAEESKDYLYIYQNIAFGKKVDTTNTIKYYNSPSLETVVEEHPINEFSMPEPDLSKFVTYKYEFVLKDGNYLLNNITIEK